MSEATEPKGSGFPTCPTMRGAGGWMGNHPETCPLRRAFRRVWERLADALASPRTVGAKRRCWPMPPFPTDVGEEPRHLEAKARPCLAWGLGLEKPAQSGR